MSFLGIDYGSARVGLALAEHGDLVLPLETLKRGGDLLAQLQKRLLEHEVKTIVVGLPLNMDGSEGPAAVRARAFSEALEKQSTAQVFLWDERLSSVEAHDKLSAAGVPQKKQRQVVDQMAAVIILQSFLDAQKDR